jgi:hypothetical protein
MDILLSEVMLYVTVWCIGYFVCLFAILSLNGKVEAPDILSQTIWPFLLLVGIVRKIYQD